MKTNSDRNPANKSEAAIFEAALACATAPERAAYLDIACAGQTDLRQRVEALLAAHEEASKFLEPKADVARPTIRLTLPPEEQPGERIGRYKLLQKIGEGGCGVVYMAEQEEPVRRRVALKVIKLGMDTKQVVARFEAERQALALMDHPNIAKVLDAGATDAGRPFFVMELVKGIPATRYADENKLDTRQRLDLFVQICQAVQHAHQKGIIHRDIKPSNVLVADHDGTPVPKVIDFGIAKATTDQRLTDKTLFTALEQFIGTPAYMSPEQAKLSGLDVDTRSDIYSLGVLLYELLTGKTPFDARRLLDAGFDEIRRIIREEEPPKPSTRLTQELVAADVSPLQSRGRNSGNVRADSRRLLQEVEGDLDWIVMKCLEKDRTRRYETANGLAADVQRHLSNEPVVACPPSAAYRFQKMVRRNKAAATSAAAILLTLSIGIVTSSLSAIRASRAERMTSDALAKAQLAQTEETKQRLRANATAESERQLRIAAADKSRQVVQLITKVIEGESISVADMLSTEENSIDKLFRDQPEDSARIHRIIGFHYAGIRDWEKARLCLRRSLEIRYQLKTSVDDLDSLNALKKLASVSLSHGRPAESGALCKKLIVVAQAKMEMASVRSDDKKVFRALELWAHRKLAQANEQEGKLAVSRPLIEKLLAALETGELQGLEAGLAWKVTAAFRLDDGNPTKALQALDKAESFLGGPGGVDYAFVNLDRASVYFVLGDYAKAESLTTANLPAVESWYGKKEFVVQRGYKYLAQLYVKTGQKEKADEFQKKLIPPIEDTELGDSALTLLGIGLFTDAEPLARKCLVASERKNSDGWQTCDARSVLGACLLGQKRFSEAEPLLVSACDGMKKFLQKDGDSYPSGPARLKETLGSLIQLLEVDGNNDRAKFYRSEFAKLNESEPSRNATISGNQK